MNAPATPTPRQIALLPFAAPGRYITDGIERVVAERMAADVKAEQKRLGNWPGRVPESVRNNEARDRMDRFAEEIAALLADGKARTLSDIRASVGIEDHTARNALLYLVAANRAVEDRSAKPFVFREVRK